MAESIFHYCDYKDYLRDRLSTHGSARGLRSRLAKTLKCQPAFVTQVINAKVHFSLEHAIEADRFFGHSETESQYFILMVSLGKAGSPLLRKYYLDQMDRIRENHAYNDKQVHAPTLSLEAAKKYYSTWVYSAVHVLLTIPGNHDSESIARRIGITGEAARKAMDFLLSNGLVEKTAQGFKATDRRVHLDDEAPMINDHHTHWRLRAIESLHSASRRDIHYSGPVSISRENTHKLRMLFINLIKSLEPILSEPGEEELYAITLDFFEL
jgi:uncharacterized protein (TIGR02147 family)